MISQTSEVGSGSQNLSGDSGKSGTSEPDLNLLSIFHFLLMISNFSPNEMALRLRSLIIQPIVIEYRKNRNKERTEIIFLGRAYIYDR